MGLDRHVVRMTTDEMRHPPWNILKLLSTPLTPDAEAVPERTKGAGSSLSLPHKLNHNTTTSGYYSLMRLVSDHTRFGYHTIRTSGEAAVVGSESGWSLVSIPGRVLIYGQDIVLPTACAYKTGSASLLVLPKTPSLWVAHGDLNRRRGDRPPPVLDDLMEISSINNAATQERFSLVTISVVDNGYRCQDLRKGWYRRRTRTEGWIRVD